MEEKDQIELDRIKLRKIKAGLVSAVITVPSVMVGLYMLTMESYWPFGLLIAAGGAWYPISILKKGE